MSSEFNHHNPEDLESKARIEEILNLELDYMMEFTPPPIDVGTLELDDKTRAQAESLIQSNLGIRGLRESYDYLDPENNSYEEE